MARNLPENGPRPAMPADMETAEQIKRDVGMGGAVRASTAAVQQLDIEQMRAELAMLRALVEQQVSREADKAKEARAHADFLAWVALTAEQRTQLVADKRFGAGSGDLWEVALQEQPTIRLKAAGEYEAIGRYCELCGITGTAHQYRAERVAAVA